MGLVKGLGTVAVAAALAAALLAPTGAEAGNGRVAAGFVDGAAVGGYDGPAPPYYPYYHYGYYGYPVQSWGPGPYWAAGPSWDAGPVYGCSHRAVWTGRHWRHVCD